VKRKKGGGGNITISVSALPILADDTRGRSGNEEEHGN